MMESQVDGLPEGVSHRNLVEVIQSTGAKVYLFGGFIRDTIRGKEAHDVDLSFATDGTQGIKRIVDAVQKRHWTIEVGMADGLYVKFGTFTEGDMQVEGRVFCGLDGTPGWQMGDFACNSLLYCMELEYIIDMTGHGVQDCLAPNNPQLRIPYVTAQDMWDHVMWAPNPWGLLYRWFRFRARGCQPCNAKERDWIMKCTEKGLHDLVFRATFCASLGWDLEEKPQFFEAVKRAMIEDYVKTYRMKISLGLLPSGEKWFQSEVHHWFAPKSKSMRSMSTILAAQRKSKCSRKGSMMHDVNEAVRKSFVEGGDAPPTKHITPRSVPDAEPLTMQEVAASETPAPGESLVGGGGGSPEAKHTNPRSPQEAEPLEVADIDKE
jgi:hypothetical protein